MNAEIFDKIKSTYTAILREEQIVAEGKAVLATKTASIAEKKKELTIREGNVNVREDAVKGIEDAHILNKQTKAMLKEANGLKEVAKKADIVTAKELADSRQVISSGRHKLNTDVKLYLNDMDALKAGRAKLEEEKKTYKAKVLADISKKLK